MMVAVTLFLFPKLALGLSGFETGVAVMPLVEGDGGNDEEVLQSRIRNTRTAAPDGGAHHERHADRQRDRHRDTHPGADLQAGGPADGRALAYLAHRDFGEVFGTLYDLSTIAILWFAGSSAMAGLLNLVPRYLPRYGMAPDWARASRPLVIVITAIAFLVTIAFKADVNAQGGAYATGVLVLMTSAAHCGHAGHGRAAGRGSRSSRSSSSTRPSSTSSNARKAFRSPVCSSSGIVAASLVSRVLRSTELRIEGVEYDDTALRVHSRGFRPPGRSASSPTGPTRASRPNMRAKLDEARRITPPARRRTLCSSSKSGPGTRRTSRRFFMCEAPTSVVSGCLRTSSPAIPNAIAGLLLDLRDRTYSIPHAYFGWTEGNPLVYLLKFLAFGEGDTAPVCREVLRKAEPEPGSAASDSSRLGSRSPFGRASVTISSHGTPMRSLERNRLLPYLTDGRGVVAAVLAVGALTTLFTWAFRIADPTIVALSFLLIVLVVAAVSSWRVAVATSLMAFLSFNFFFLPPTGTFAIADAQHWVALLTLLFVSLVGSYLSSEIRHRAEEAMKADVARHSAELKSSLLASLGHDLKTPLTALTVAANNLNASWLTNEQRLEQAEVVRAELARLNRLFQNLIDMARIESHAVTAEREWVSPADIVEASTQQVESSLVQHRLDVDSGNESLLVRLDPRLDIRGARTRPGERRPAFARWLRHLGDGENPRERNLV